MRARSTYVALLRAVNLGGVTQLSMGRLRALLEAEGFDGVRTLLQSGNAIFAAAGTDGGALERRLERRIEREFGRRTEVFVRSEREWRGIQERNPFVDVARDDPQRLQMALLKATPPTEAWERLRASIPGRERVEGRGREAYLVYPDGVGRSKLTTARIESALGTRITSRNWNTVGRIAEALAGR